MEASCLQIIRDFIAETELLIKHVDELSQETAIELYSMYESASISATLNITQIDPELRVVLCDRQDRILERIIDIAPFNESTSIHGVYTPAIQGYRRWKNVELLKDKGLVGYMLANELGVHSVMMFGTKPEDYPYQELLPGLDVLCSDADANNPHLYFEHMDKNHLKMDMLVLHGMYSETIGYLDTYRKYRPDGKVYCGLDMNSYWMNNITWDSESVRTFAKQCDVITTSCRMLRDALNRNPKVNFPCHWIPNGFLNISDAPIIADAKIKKNIILTVGRIGTAEKNNSELLLAFGNAHKKMPGWKLRLVGSIDPNFKPFIDEYFQTFPQLRERVIFTGEIADKAELYKEYAQAKLFAFTSRIEGSPNVYAEALVHGCMFVTSDIGAADDITNFGELGRKYKRGDVNGLSNALVRLSEKADNKKLKKHILKALIYANKHYDWRRNAKKLAYMLHC